MENKKNITSPLPLPLPLPLPPYSNCLPLEIESNILSRLSIKDLLRYQCVCKRWRDEIKNPNFIKSHTSQIIKSNNTHSRAYVILFCRWSAKLYSLDYQSPENVKKLTRFSHPLNYDAQLVGSCNGLLCFIKRLSRVFSIYNPVTNTCKDVDVSPLRPYYVFDVNAKYIIGFGYDCTSNDYKILQAGTDNMSSELVKSTLHVYSLKNDSWKAVQPLTMYLSTYTNRMVYSNNALHWIDLKHNNSTTTEIMSKIITCFDLGTEEYHELPLPNDDGDFNFVLADIKGCLHLVKFSTIFDGMEIWVMKEYGVKQTWSKLVSVELDDIAISNIIRRQLLVGQPFDPLPLAYSKDGQEVLVGLGQPGMDFVQFDTGSAAFKRLKVQACDLETDFRDTYVVMPWVGSFVSPHLY